MEAEDSIQVVIRVKPSSEPVISQFISYSDREIILGRNTFAFDRIFGTDCQQQDIFMGVGTKLVANSLQGYNSCIFAYGQTGSGKTHTMVGQGDGLIQRSIQQLFQRMSINSSVQYVVTCSYFQIYNEQVVDLLDQSAKKLNVRQDLKKGVFVQNLSEQPVESVNKAVALLNQGIRSRHIGQTLMNRQSSRSHAVFSLYIQSRIMENGIANLRTSKLHFVDLAGSERQKATACVGERLKQASNINRSLTTLGMVINCLSGEKHRVHIPFRDSKLTFLLKDSLGGNSKTFIVATVSSLPESFQQTLSTLKFAQRAKMVKLSAHINQQSVSVNVQFLKAQLAKRQQERDRLAEIVKSQMESIQQLQEIVKQAQQAHAQQSAVWMQEFSSLRAKLQRSTENQQQLLAERLTLKAEIQKQESVISEWAKQMQILNASKSHTQQLNSRLRMELQNTVFSWNQQIQSALQGEVKHQAEIKELKTRCLEQIQRKSVQHSAQKQMMSVLVQQKDRLNSVLNSDNQTLKQTLQRVMKERQLTEQLLNTSIHTLHIQLSSSINTTSTLTQQLHNITTSKDEQIQTLKSQLQLLESQYKDHISRIDQLQYQLQHKTKSLQQLQYQLQHKTKSLQILQVQVDQHKQLRNKAQQQIQHIRQTYIPLEQSQHLKAKLNQFAVTNYKLRNKSISSTPTTTSNLQAKIQYYEEKFNLMKIEYANSVETARRLKLRETQLLEEVCTLKDRLKSAQMEMELNTKNDIQTHLLSQVQQLRHSNQQLKATIKAEKKVANKQNAVVQIQTLKKDKQALSSTLGLVSTKLFSILRNLRQITGQTTTSKQEQGDQCKQVIKLLSLFEEFLKRKQGTLSRNLRREQQLRAQNNFVLKQNLYLKERVKELQASLQVDRIVEMAPQPHKRSKIS